MNKQAYYKIMKMASMNKKRGLIKQSIFPFLMPRGVINAVSPGIKSAGKNLYNGFKKDFNLLVGMFGSGNSNTSSNNNIKNPPASVPHPIRPAASTPSVTSTPIQRPVTNINTSKMNSRITAPTVDQLPQLQRNISGIARDFLPGSTATKKALDNIRGARLKQLSNELDRVMSTLSGGATGSAVGGATGSAVGGATGSAVGGATGSAVGGAILPKPTFPSLDELINKFPMRGYFPPSLKKTWITENPDRINIRPGSYLSTFKDRYPLFY